MQPAGGVEDDNIAAEASGLFNRSFTTGERDLLALGERAQLLDRGRAAEVEAGEERAVAVATRQQRELDRGRRLARALEPDQHDHSRRVRRVAQALGIAAEQPDKLVVDSLDDSLRSGESGRDLGAGQARADILHELPDDLEVHVRLEKSKTHLPQPGVDIL